MTLSIARASEFAMADVFLSYKREDRDKVRPLVEALQAQGWSVWWDTRIGVGDSWDEEIEKELAVAKCVVVVWSRLSVNSRWVRTEAHEGLERQCLVPVLIDGAKAPLAFKLIQASDLNHWKGDAADSALAEVTAGVRRIVDRHGRAAQPAEGVEPPGEAGEVQAEIFNKRGRDYFDKKDYDRAITELSKAIEVDRKFALAYNNRGNAFVAKRDTDHGIADYREAIEIDPEYATAYYNRGRAHYYKNQRDQAVADFTKAIEIDAEFAAAHYFRGLMHVTGRDYDAAIADLSRAIEIDPDYTLAYHQRSLAYRNRKKAGDVERARADDRLANIKH